MLNSASVIVILLDCCVFKEFCLLGGLISLRVNELFIQIFWRFYVTFCDKNNCPIRSQFCTCHNSSFFMTCANLWLDLIRRTKIRAIRIFIRFHLSSHKLFVPGQLQVSQTWMNNYIPQNTVGCNYLSLQRYMLLAGKSSNMYNHGLITHWPLGDLNAIPKM